LAGLAREQQFDKKEMTASDIVLMLVTLWTRARDIPCEPRERVAFHSLVVLDGIGGWRPGSLIGMKYGQVSLAIVRDPASPARTLPVVTPTIYHNKRRKKRILKSQDEK